MTTPVIFNNTKPDGLCNQSKFDLWLDYFHQSCRELNFYGDEFLKAFKATSCPYFFDEKLEGKAQNPEQEVKEFLNAQAASGMYYPLENEVRIGPHALNDISDFYSIVFHEGIHAIQYNTCPHLHAYIGSNNLLSLTPFDLIIQNQLMEMDAFAKGLLFSLLHDSLGKEDDVDFSSMPDKLHEILCDIASDTLDIVDFGTETTSCLYIDKALNWIEGHIDNLSNDEIRNLEFTTLSSENLWDLCNSMNLQSVYKDQSVVDLPNVKFNDGQLKRIEIANAKLGIEDRNKLRSFDAALNDFGIEKEQFLQTMTS